MDGGICIILELFSSAFLGSRFNRPFKERRKFHLNSFKLHVCWNCPVLIFSHYQRVLVDNTSAGRHKDFGYIYRAMNFEKIVNF